MSPQQAKLRVEELKADVRDGGDPATIMQKNFELRRNWLGNTTSIVMKNSE